VQIGFHLWQDPYGVDSHAGWYIDDVTIEKP
jgi:hypothetical protein